MFLQRLVADNRPNGCGLNYDYMGSAEFELGATRIARIALAKLQIEKNFTGKKVRFFAKWGRSCYGPVDAYVFGSRKVIDSIGIAPPQGTNVPYDLVVTADKESPRLDNDKIVGWMSVLTDSPVLIIRATDDNIERGNMFLQLFMTGILDDEKEARQQICYHYQNNWTLRLINGPVLALGDDTPPTEGGERWVMFDETNKAIDQSDYFATINQEHRRYIGDPLPVKD